MSPPPPTFGKLLGKMFNISEMLVIGFKFFKHAFSMIQKIQNILGCVLNITEISCKMLGWKEGVRSCKIFLLIFIIF